MSYVLQQKHHTYINYDVNRLANVWVLISGNIDYFRSLMCAVGLGWMDKRAEVLVREPLKEREKKKTKGKKKEEQVKLKCDFD